MKKFFLIFILFSSSNIFAQNNNPQPPFSNLHRRPNVHPYTFINPTNNAMDYQQMLHMQNNRESLGNINLQQKFIKKQNNYQYVPQFPYYGIRPTGHKTYFMNLP